MKRRTPGRQNLLALLANEFSVRDAQNVRMKQGMDTKGTRNMLNQWKHRGYILQMTNDNYKKSENYKSKV